MKVIAPAQCARRGIEGVHGVVLRRDDHAGADEDRRAVYRSIESLGESGAEAVESGLLGVIARTLIVAVIRRPVGRGGDGDSNGYDDSKGDPAHTSTFYGCWRFVQGVRNGNRRQPTASMTSSD